MAYCPICGTETNEVTGRFNLKSAEHICRICNIRFDWWYEDLDKEEIDENGRYVVYFEDTIKVRR